MINPETTSVEDMAEETVLSLFESCQLPRRMWNHRAHVTVAYLYLRQHALPEAMAKLRAGIQEYNAVAGQGTGYHETVTQVWTRLIYAVMKNHGVSDCARHFFNRHNYLLDKTLPLLFYSDRRLMSPEARTGFLEPDLLPLPEPARLDQTEFQREPIDVPIPRDPYEELKHLNGLIEQEPQNSYAICQRGQMHLRRGELTAALADLEQAIAIDPDQAEAYFWLATVKAYSDEGTAAIENLRRALERGYRWFGAVYKLEGWRKLSKNPQVEALLRRYAEKYQMTL